ncbi:hypothetical protein BKA67DRAFT_515520, partial [Truncatella angustata]
VILIFWILNDASIKQKMAAAIGEDTLRRCPSGMRIEMQASNADGLAYEAIMLEIHR